MDLFESQVDVFIGSNISIRDYEPLPGQEDEASEVEVEIFVGDGQLHLEENATNRSSAMAFAFNSTLAGFRASRRKRSAWPFEPRRRYKASASRRRRCTTVWCTWRFEWPCGTRRRWPAVRLASLCTR